MTPVRIVDAHMSMGDVVDLRVARVGGMAIHRAGYRSFELEFWGDTHAELGW